MKNPLSFITSKLKSAGTLSRPSSFSQENVLFFGTLSAIAILLGVLAWDGYLFMKSSQRHTTTEPFVPKTKELSATDLDDALKILADRRQRFTAMLGTSTVSPIESASSTPSASPNPIQ